MIQKVAGVFNEAFGISENTVPNLGGAGQGKQGGEDDDKEDDEKEHCGKGHHS